MSTNDQETYVESSDEEFSDYDFSDDEQEEEESFLEWTMRTWHTYSPTAKNVIMISSDYGMWVANKAARLSFYAVTTAAFFLPLIMAQNSEQSTLEYFALKNANQQQVQQNQQAQAVAPGAVGIITSTGIPGI